MADTRARSSGASPTPVTRPVMGSRRWTARWHRGRCRPLPGRRARPGRPLVVVELALVALAAGGGADDLDVVAAGLGADAEGAGRVGVVRAVDAGGLAGRDDRDVAQRLPGGVGHDAVHRGSGRQDHRRQRRGTRDQDAVGGVQRRLVGVELADEALGPELELVGPRLHGRLTAPPLTCWRPSGGRCPRAPACRPRRSRPPRCPRRPSAWWSRRPAPRRPARPALSRGVRQQEPSPPLWIPGDVSPVAFPAASLVPTSRLTPSSSSRRLPCIPRSPWPRAIPTSGDLKPEVPQPPAKGGRNSTVAPGWTSTVRGPPYRRAGRRPVPHRRRARPAAARRRGAAPRRAPAGRPASGVRRSRRRRSPRPPHDVPTPSSAV